MSRYTETRNSILVRKLEADRAKLIAALRDAAQILTRYGAHASATEFRMLLASLKAQEVRL